MTPAETHSAVAHLMRRAGFGATADEVDALAAGGYVAAVKHVLAFDGPDAGADAVAAPTFDTAGYLASRRQGAAGAAAAGRQLRTEGRALVLWWLQRMVAAERPLREKLAWCWHDHFATSLRKVRLPELMQRQLQTLTELGGGRFDALLTAVVADPAMLLWLDGARSTGADPNENFAREFFELFTLGHGTGGHHGTQPYSEDDVAAAARAFTGWRIQPATGASTFDASRHDAATKTVLGLTGPLDGDDVVARTVTQAACAPHVVARLWSRLARPAGPDDEVVRELAAPFAADLDVTALLQRMFLHEDFLSARTRTGLVKTPVDYVVGIARTLQVPLELRHLAMLRDLGQIPFVPPDVSGWPENEGWLSTASAQARLEVATAFAAAADVGAIETLTAPQRPAAVARLLGVDAWSAGTAGVLADAAGDVRSLLVLALVAPEHVLA